jgi:hypothetical protein
MQRKMHGKRGSRVAVVVPMNRMWHWHHTIISILRQDFEIDVYTSAQVRRYPTIIRLWMRLERFAFGEFDLARHVITSAPLWCDAQAKQYSLIFNFSEASLVSSDLRVIEPRFEGHLDSLKLLAVLFARQNPYISVHIGQAHPIVASYLAIQDRIVLSRGLRVSFARLVVLIERAVHHLKQGTCAAILPTPAKVVSYDKKIRASLFLVRFLLDKSFGRLCRRLQYREHWSVALLQLDQWKMSSGQPSLKDAYVLPDDGKRYYADPFLFSNNGQNWLFVEEYDYGTGKGCVSCAEIVGPKIKPPTQVLVRPYHLSYPFVFRHQGGIYMIPESGANRTVELYRARAFPFEWELVKVLLRDVELYEATLFWYEERWWMFCAMAHQGGSTQDELAIFYSESLEGPWSAHRLNPVKSDCRSARPAGRVIIVDRRLVRPAQDCEARYGSSLVWLEIEELTPECFREREIARWYPTATLRANGMHTFNCDSELGVMDFRRTLWKLRSRYYAEI